MAVTSDGDPDHLDDIRFGGPVVGRFGIDMLAVQFPVAKANASAAWSYFNGQRGKANVEVRRGVKAHLSLYEVREQGLMAELEFNPARLTEGDDTYGLCAVDDVFDTLDTVLAAVAKCVVPDVVPELMTVSRLDVARDFTGLENINATLRALVLNDPSRCAQKKMWFSVDGKNQAETLKFGADANFVQLYDKAAQMRAKRVKPAAPEGTLRYEVRARKGKWLDAPKGPSIFVGIGPMASVTQGNVEALAWHRWEWAGAGACIVAPDLFQMRVAQFVDDPLAQDAFIGHCFLRAVGLRPSDVPDRKRAYYKRLLRRLGVVPDPAFLMSHRTQWGQVLYRRLDLASGQEVEVNVPD